jgi:tripartite-type tricarboxylate transporter receptor subunit TctC
VVENIGGGGGAIACQTTAKAAPDGYTLLQGYVATHGTSPATRSKLPYDPVADFTPVGMIGATPNVLVVNAALPVSTLTAFVDYLRQHPGAVSYGSAGQGSLTHLTMELLKQATGTYAVHLPYRGVAPAFTDLLGGQTQAMFPGLAAALPHIRSGRVRPLAVTGITRHPLLKDVPTLIELGYSGFDAQQWYGVVGPAGMPVPVVKTLNDTLGMVLAAPDLRERLAGEAVEPIDVARGLRTLHPCRHRALDPPGPRAQDRTRQLKTHPWPATPRSSPTPTPHRSRGCWRVSWPPTRRAAGATPSITRRRARCSTGWAVPWARRATNRSKLRWRRCACCSPPNRPSCWAGATGSTWPAPR